MLVSHGDYDDDDDRVAKCHGCDGNIIIEKMTCWGKKFGKTKK